MDKVEKRQLKVHHKLEKHQRLTYLVGSYLMDGISKYGIGVKHDLDYLDLVDLFIYFDLFDSMLQMDNIVYEPEFKKAVQQIIKNTKEYFAEKNQEVTFDTLCQDLEERFLSHDASKLEKPEITLNEEYLLAFSKAPIGSCEYYRLDKLLEKPHQQSNRHHPEFFSNDVSKMSLNDLLEMIVDWRSHWLEKNDNFHMTLIKAREQYHIEPYLYSLISLTAFHYTDVLEDKREKDALLSLEVLMKKSGWEQPVNYKVKDYKK